MRFSHSVGNKSGGGMRQEKLVQALNQIRAKHNGVPPSFNSQRICFPAREQSKIFFDPGSGIALIFFFSGTSCPISCGMGDGSGDHCHSGKTWTRPVSHVIFQGHDYLLVEGPTFALHGPKVHPPTYFETSLGPYTYDFCSCGPYRNHHRYGGY